MLNARMVALIAVLIWVLPLLAPGIRAQDAGTLPPGVQSVDVDGQPIDSVTIPVTNNASPEVSGRAELGVPVIELVVGDVEPIRFTAELDDRGRFRAAVPQALADGQYSLAIGDFPIGAFTVDSTAQAAAENDQPRGGRSLFDIARVVPYPADFGDLLPGLGLLDGRFYTIDEEAARTAAANGGTTAEDLRSTRRGLADAGWLQRYESRLAVPNSESPDVFDVQFSSFVVEYASADDASAAFATLTGDDPAEESPLVGDESALTLLTGVTPDTGSEYQAARLMFRVGPMLGMIVYADLLGQTPDLALLDTVAQAVAVRAVVVADRETVPLGAMALQLDPSPATGRLVQRDLYDVRAGALTALYSEDDASRESRIELYTGTTDAFSSMTNGAFTPDEGGGGNRDDRERDPEQQQEQPAEPTPTSVIAIEGESPAPATAATPPATIINWQTDTEVESESSEPAQVFMTSALYAFPGENEADAWLTAQGERLVAGAASGSGTFSEVSDAPALGDSSATFATQRAVGAGEETANGFRFYSRVGAIVAVLEIGSSSDLPLNTATRMMELQVGCIEAEGCAGLASLAGRLVGGVEDEASESDAEEPEQASIEEPGAERPARAPRERDQQPAPPPAPEPPPAPIEEPTVVPIEEPTPIPIEEPTPVPVEEPTPPPVDEGTPPPVDEGTPPPAEEPTPPPAEEPTPVPGEEPTPVPGEEPTPVPGEEPTPVPGEEPTQVPGEEPTPPPAGEPTAIPTPAPDVDNEPPPDEDRDRRGNNDDRDRDRDRRGGRD